MPYRELTSLHFNHSEIQDGGSAHVAELLKPSVASKIQLTSLHLIGDSLTGRGWEHMSVGLAANQTLKDLNLDDNASLDDNAARILCAGLWLKLNLVTLSLKRCSVGPAGAEHLAKYLGQPGVALESLDLERNPLSPVGLVNLSQGIRASTRLQHLCLRHTEIGAGV